MSNIKKKEDSKKISILLLGDSNVGKTSIFKKFFKNEFKGNYTSTIGVEFLTKEFQYKNKNYSIQFFDTAGQERFRSLTESYYHLGEGFFIVFDLTNKNSLMALPSWIESLKEHIEKPIYIILGNKSDLEKNLIPDQEINEVLNDKDNLKINDENFLKVSAKTGENINKTFEYILNIIEQTSDKDEQIIKQPIKKVKINKKKMKCC